MINTSLAQKILEFPKELPPLICNDLCTGPKVHEYMPGERLGCASRILALQWNCHHKLAVMLDGYKYILVTICGFRKWSGQVNAPPIEQAHDG
jgi:hypothetical protein